MKRYNLVPKPLSKLTVNTNVLICGGNVATDSLNKGILLEYSQTDNIAANVKLQAE